MTKIAPENDMPVACSVCRQAPSTYSPRLRFLDFESAYDGPVIPVADNPTIPPVYVEKIVICEKCVKQAGRLLDMTDSSTPDATESWKLYADSLEKEVEAKDRAISNLSYTVGDLLDNPPKRPLGRPQYQGPDTHQNEIKELASKRSKRERMKKATANGAGSK